MRNIAFRAFAAILIAASFVFSALAAEQDPYDVVNTAAGKLFPRINDSRAT